MTVLKGHSRKTSLRKMIRKANRKRKASGFEKQIHALLREEGIAFTKEKTIGRCHADIVIDGTRVVLEGQGCYWHACRKCFPNPSKMQLEAKAKDARRFYFFRKLGFTVLEIWECEFAADRDNVVKQIKRALSNDVG